MPERLSNGRNSGQTQDIFTPLYPPPGSVMVLGDPAANFDGMRWNRELNLSDAVYGKSGGPMDGAAYYWPVDANGNRGYWRIPVNVLPGWNYSQPSTQRNHPAGMRQEEIAALPLDPTQQQQQQQQQQQASSLEEQRRQLREERQRIADERALARERAALQRERERAARGATYDDDDFNLFDADDDDDGADFFTNDDGGTDDMSPSKMMAQMFNMQMTMMQMQQMQQIMSSMSPMGGGGGGMSGLIGPILQRQGSQTLLANQQSAATTLRDLTFTTAGATGAEVGALRDAIVNGIVAPVANFAQSNSSAGLVSALSAPGAMNSGAAVALALIPASSTVV